MTKGKAPMGDHGDPHYKQKYCVRCGADLGVVWHSVMYCQECKTALVRARKRQYQKEVRRRRAEAEKPRILTAAECAYIDRSLGMTYGAAQQRGLHTATVLARCREAEG